MFGFFGTLIAGVAQHLLPRFTGRPVVRRPWLGGLAAVLGAALVVRFVGTAVHWPIGSLVGAILQAAGFSVFAAEVWRILDPPPLALLRRQLVACTFGLALAMAGEAVARAVALAGSHAVPAAASMRAVHAIGLVAVLGWVLGVLLRAGPMFVPGWAVPTGLARWVPWGLGLAALLVVAAEVGPWGLEVRTVTARAGDALSVGLVAALALIGGALRPSGSALPVVGRSGPEARIFRLAVVSAVVGTAVFGGAAVLGALGGPVHLLTDAARHLVTVGFITGVVVAMAFRLIPVLERVALPWPALRVVAFWMLFASVALRTAQVAVGHGWPAVAPLVALSGCLAWVAVACVGANLAAAMMRVPPDRVR